MICLFFHMSFLLPKISKILSSGKGVKCLLFDSYTKHSLSSLIPHSLFLDNDYFLFDDIQSQKSKININCVCVINISSIKFLIEEISDPSYRSYTVLFTSTVDPYLLNILAKNDVHGVIEEVHEIYMDYCKQDTRFFTNLYCIDDFIYSLGSIPTVYTYHNKNMAGEILSEEGGRLNEEGGRLFVIYREYDQITPLLIDWHYQSMIKKYLEYDNCLVTVNNIKYNIEDDFFNKNKFKNISDVSTNLEELVKELDLKKRIKKVNIREIEEINKLSEVVNKHMEIYKSIIENIEEKRKISEEEIKILQDYKKTNINVKTNIFNKYLTGSKYEIKKNEDIKLSYIPPIRKILRNINKKKMDDWVCKKERFNKNKYTVFYFKGGVTYTEYRYIMEMYGDKEEVYVVSEKVI